ncbi:hypothetical protein ABFS83_13G178400 [Erythranthe nasuta]
MIKQQKEFVPRAIFRFGSKSMTSECRPYPNTRRFRPTLSEQAAYLDAAEPVDEEEASDFDSSGSDEELVDSNSLESGDYVLRKEWEWDGQLIVDINQNRSKGVHQIKYLNNSLLTGLKTMGIKNLSPLQMAIVNSTVRHEPFQTDLYVSSPKGTGKRLGYAIPIVESVTKEDGLQALIVVRDRTSALKVRSIFLQLTCYMEISVGIAVPFLPSSEESDCIVDDRESTSDMITENCQVLICTPDALMKSEVGLGELKYLVIDDMEHLLREDQLEENQFTSRLPTKLEVAKICTTEQNVTDLTNLNGLGLKNPKVLLTGPFAGGMCP